MPLYETMFMARQDLTSAQVEDLANNFAKVITDGDGKIVKKDHWGLKTLAYRIQKNKKAYYVLMNIDAPAPTVLEMERQIRLNEDVLRYMTVRVESFDEDQDTKEKEAA